MPSPTLVSRERWGARDPKSITPLVQNVQRGTALHYSGSLAEVKEDHANCAGVVRGIQNFHMDIRGWADIAYSFICCIHGAVFTGRGRGVRTAANGTTNGNSWYHAVCFLGGDKVDRADVTEEGKIALRYAIHSCNEWSGATSVRPHSSFKATACPGDELRDWLQKGMPVQREEPEMTPEEFTTAMESSRVQAAIARAVAAPLKKATPLGILLIRKTGEAAVYADMGSHLVHLDNLTRFGVVSGAESVADAVVEIDASADIWLLPTY